MSPSTLITNFKPNPNPLPTYFISHGAPTFLYKHDSFTNKQAYNTITKLGSKISNDLKPNYIIIFSAHWQSKGSNLIQISYPFNSKIEENNLIYDFYGFPNHLYKEEFHSKSNWNLVNIIKNELEKNSNFNVEIIDRGLDHGSWIPLKLLFSNYNFENKLERNTTDFDLDIPIIQISLTSNEFDFDSHFKLGELIQKFKNSYIKDNNTNELLKGLIICSGMTVHNLRDIGKSFQQKNQIMPYVKPFNQALNRILLTDDKINKESLLSNFNQLKLNSLLKMAHPTLEHFVPIVIASGTTNENIKQLFNDESLSLGWGIYEFN